MLKTYYRNKFRVRNTLTNRIVKLKQSVNKNGDDIFVSTFNSFDEAATELNRFLQFVPHYKPYYIIESFSDTVPHDLDINDEAVHKELKRLKLFSGKGLAENTRIRKRDENRYSPDKFYTRDIWFAQSAFHNKGTSLVSKLADKRQTQLIVDSMPELTNDGTFTLGKCIVDELRSLQAQGKFANRLAIKQFLRERGYSSRKIHKLCNQMFM